MRVGILPGRAIQQSNLTLSMYSFFNSGLFIVLWLFSCSARNNPAPKPVTSVIVAKSVNTKLNGKVVKSFSDRSSLSAIGPPPSAFRQ